jgi:hypothetical protein
VKGFLGLDLQAIWMTMFSLVALYLVITHPQAVNNLIRSGGRFVNTNLLILQGRGGRAAIAAQ